MNVQDDEAAEHKEKVNADMPEMGQRGIETITRGFVDVAADVVKHHRTSGGTAQGFDQFELVAM
jgi:hypothetical protein